MKTKTVITTETSNITFGYWDTEKEEFVPIEYAENSIELGAQKLNCSPELLEAMDMFATNIRDIISEDLRDIWKRLDGAGIP